MNRPLFVLGGYNTQTGNTHWLTAHLKARVVTDAVIMRILNKLCHLAQNLYWYALISDVLVRDSRAAIDVYRLFVCLRRYLIKKSDHNDKFLSTDATFGFAKLLVLSVVLYHADACAHMMRQFLSCDLYLFVACREEFVKLNFFWKFVNLYIGINLTDL